MMTKLSDTAKANKYRYDSEYLKENYKTFAVCLPKSEYEDYCELLKKLNVSKINFIRNTFKELKKSVK